jgi:E3 ubiquitin-protein transferase RMND5
VKFHADNHSRWVEANQEFLKSRDSPLEFLLRRSYYLRLLTSIPRKDLLFIVQYAQKHLAPLRDKYPEEIQKLFGCIPFSESLETSYPMFASPAIHSCLESAFSTEYCASKKVSKQPPLKLVANIGGGIALPRIEKGKKIMKERKGEWSHTDEIPVWKFSVTCFNTLASIN